MHIYALVPDLLPYLGGGCKGGGECLFFHASKKAVIKVTILTTLEHGIVLY